MKMSRSRPLRLQQSWHVPRWSPSPAPPHPQHLPLALVKMMWSTAVSWRTPRGCRSRSRTRRWSTIYGTGQPTATMPCGQAFAWAPCWYWSWWASSSPRCGRTPRFSRTPRASQSSMNLTTTKQRWKSNIFSNLRPENSRNIFPRHLGVKDRLT